MVPWRRDWRVYTAAGFLLLAAVACAAVISSAQQRNSALTSLATERQQERALVGEIAALKRDQAASVEQQQATAVTLDYLTRELAALRRQIRRMGGKPVEVQRTTVVTVRPRSSPVSSPTPRPRPTRSRTPSPSPSPSPSSCPPLPVCPPARG